MRAQSFDALMVCSQLSLQDLKLARLSEAANYRKQLIEIFDAIVDAQAQAQLAQAILEWQQATGKCPRIPEQHAFDFPELLPPKRISRKRALKITCQS